MSTRPVHSIRCSNEVWNRAKESGINITALVEEQLKGATSSKAIDIKKQLAYCNYCNKEKPLSEIYATGCVDKMGLIIKCMEDPKLYTICSDCINKIREPDFKHDNSILDTNEIRSLLVICVELEFTKAKDDLSLPLIYPEDFKSFIDVAIDDGLLCWKYGQGWLRVPNLKDMANRWKVKEDDDKTWMNETYYLKNSHTLRLICLMEHIVSNMG